MSSILLFYDHTNIKFIKGFSRKCLYFINLCLWTFINFFFWWKTYQNLFMLNSTVNKFSFRSIISIIFPNQHMNSCGIQEKKSKRWLWHDYVQYIFEKWWTNAELRFHFLKEKIRSLRKKIFNLSEINIENNQINFLGKILIVGFFHTPKN